MLSSSKIKKIRKLHDQGMKVSAIARETGADRKTIRKYISNAEPCAHSAPSSKLDPYKSELDRMLREDRRGTRKWTAAAMHRELCRNAPELADSYLLVQRYAKNWKEKHK